MNNHDVVTGYQDGPDGRAADPGFRDKEAYRDGWLIGRQEWRERADPSTFAEFDSNGRAPPPPTGGRLCHGFTAARVWPVRLER